MNLRTRLFSFVLVLIVIQVLAQPPVCSYKYRKRITFNASQVSGGVNLSDFPAYITIASDPNLESVSNGGHVESDQGYDILFTSDNGITPLDYDLTSYDDATGALVCWVKIPTLSASVNTNIYLYYGNASVSTTQTSSATWSNGYVGVWHFDGGTNNVTTTAGLNGSNNGTSNTTTAKIGTARNFNGTSNYVDVTPYNAAYDITSNITVSAWINLSSNGDDMKIAGNQNGTTGGWKFGVFSDNKVEMEIRTSAGTPELNRSVSGGSTLNTGTWYYVAGQYSNAGDFIRTFRNGTLDRTLATTAVLGASNGTMKFGREPFGNSAYFDGRMDEVRLSNVIRSAGWIATEYNNQNSPGTFYSISGEPRRWDGSNNSNWGTAANWTPNTTPTANSDVIIAPAGNQPLLNNTPAQLNSLWLLPTTTLQLSTRTLRIAYDIVNCGVITGNTGLVHMNGSDIQNQSMGGDGSYNLNNLTIDNTFPVSPSVTLNSPVGVSAASGTGLLTLTSGILVTSSANLLTLGNNATSTSGSSVSFVSGPMTKSGSANFVFPVGKGSKWARLRTSGYSATANFRVEYFDHAYTSTTPVTAPLTDVSVLEYWQVDKLSGGTAAVSLYWENAAASGINLCSDLTVARWNSTSWVQEASAVVGASTTCNGSNAGSIATGGALTTYGALTFGSRTSGTINPLPIGLTTFTAACEGSVINLGWTTATERNNDHFLIERSSDALTWLEIGQVKGAGTSFLKHNYEFQDSQKDKAYYRLTEVNDHGEVGQRWITEVSCGVKLQMRVFPNPSAGPVSVKFTLPGRRADGLLKVYDVMGRLCYSANLRMEGKQIVHTIPSLPGGTYMALFSSSDVKLPPQKFIIVK